MKHPIPTILVVDDDEGHAILIRENLEAVGLADRVRHFNNGEALLDFLSRRAADVASRYLLLLDIRMPRMDGTEVLRRLRDNPHTDRMPVVMLTTTDDAREMERCYDLGCSLYLQKPVDYDRFAEVIRRLGLFASMLLVPELRPR
jgi:CheY-like chemotaxis protein